MQQDNWHKKAVFEAQARLSHFDYLKDTQMNHYKKKESKYD